MGKRSNFERRERDFYPTPYEAIVPLLPHLKAGMTFVEPCAGAGDLCEHLKAAGFFCREAGDIEPRGRAIVYWDATKQIFGQQFDCFITNPPWARETLHSLIINLSDQLPTWLLFDADWVHTRQAIPYLDRLRDIVSVGRIKWIPDSKMTGKDNCAWHLFSEPGDLRKHPTRFHGRC